MQYVQFNSEKCIPHQLMTKKLDGAVVGCLKLTYDAIIGHLLK